MSTETEPKASSTPPLPPTAGDGAGEPAAGRPVANYRVLVPAGTAIAVFALWALLAKDSFDTVLGEAVTWTSTWFGWFYILLATSILVFVLYIALSRHGRTRLGPSHSTPQFSTWAWASMLFAAGIGTDLMFFAVAEPVAQYMAPPSTEAQTVDAAREAIAWTLFHYGISGWGMYALMGMALGYFAYRMNLPLAIRSALRPIFRGRVDGALGDAVDVAAIVGTIFGVATTLGIAVVQLNFGLFRLLNIPEGLPTQVGLLAFGVGMATLSAVSGVERGIKWLSQLNVILALGLAVWVVVTGRTSELLNALVLNIGDFVRLFPDMMLQTFPYEDNTEWLAAWTLFFWAWWVAWASFVGLFLARISRGRTIRQFVVGTLTIPFSYILMWVAIYGNAAIDLIRSGNTEFGELAMNVPEHGFYTLLEQYPWFFFTAGLATFTGLLFYVTSADSGALVMANLSSKLPDVHTDGSSALRIFWAAAVGILTVAMLSVDSIYSLMNATVVMGLPFSFVLVLVMIGLYKSLKVEAELAAARKGVLPGLLSGRSPHDGIAHTAWKTRINRVMTFPTAERADAFMHEDANPALEEVAAELRQRGVEANVSWTEDDHQPCLQLTAEVGEGEPFTYRITRTMAPIPSYGGWIPRETDVYARLEVHLARGGEGYDVMGYSRAQLIDDVIDQYERHLEFLRLHHNAETPT